MASNANTGKYLSYVEWLSYSPEERSSLALPGTATAYAKSIGVSKITLMNWKKKAIKTNEFQQKNTAVIAPPIKDDSRGRFDTKGYMKARQREICDKLLERLASGRGNAKDFELFYKLTGNLEPPVKTDVVKEEKKDAVTINIGNLIAIARKELNNGGDGDFREVEVSDVTTILPRKVLPDTRPGNRLDASVQTVGLSEKSPQDNQG